MVEFPEISPSYRMERLEPPQKPVRMVLDTDAYNEVDDQFALAYALLSRERLDVEAVYAAPFHNSRSTGPADGMEKSYQEIQRLLALVDRKGMPQVFRGSRRYLDSGFGLERSEAALDMIRRAQDRAAGRLYVVAIGAITNVANAILIDPDIIRRIVVVWLGGHAHHWPDTREFNLRQDPDAARVVFDSGVPLVQVPCLGAASHLVTTLPELRDYVRGRGALGDSLYEIVADYADTPFAWSKVLWDLSAVAYLVQPDWIPTDLVPSPVLTPQLTWQHDPSRHLIRVAYFVRRDLVYADLFRKLEAHHPGDR